MNGHRIWRFLLRRDDPEPAPWTEAGRYRIRKFGLTLQYPKGWCKEIAQKRCWKVDEKILHRQNQLVNEKRRKTCLNTIDDNEHVQPYYEIPDHLKQLILLDQINLNQWKSIIETKMTKRVNSNN